METKLRVLFVGTRNTVVSKLALIVENCILRQTIALRRTNYLM